MRPQKTTVGAWLLPGSDSKNPKPIAMKDCDFNGATSKQPCIFIGVSDPAAPTNDFGKLAPNYSETQKGKPVGGFELDGKTYKSPDDYVENAPGDVNNGEMWVALWAKYTQNPELGKELMDTKNAILVADWDGDRGIGPDGKGSNEYGRLLMLIREELVKAQKTFAAGKPLPATDADWKALQAPTPHTTAGQTFDAYLNADFEKWAVSAKDNTTADFKRTPTQTTECKAYDAEPGLEKKKKFIEEAFQLEQAALEHLWRVPHQCRTGVNIQTKKNAQGQEEPSITVNGDKTEIVFEIEFDRTLLGEGKESIAVTVARTKNPDGSIEFLITPVDPKKPLTLQKSFELEAALSLAMREQEQKQYLDDISKLTGKLSAAEEQQLKALTKKQRDPATPLAEDEQAILDKLTAKKSSPEKLLTKTEQDELKTLESKIRNPRIAVLTVDDKFGETIDKQEITVRGGKKLTLEHATKKQATAIVAYLEKYDEISFTNRNGVSQTFTAAKGMSGPSIVTSVVQAPDPSLPVDPLNDSFAI